MKPTVPVKPFNPTLWDSVRGDDYRTVYAVDQARMDVFDLALPDQAARAAAALWPRANNISPWKVPTAVNDVRDD
jgi:hypothetical protein